MAAKRKKLAVRLAEARVTLALWRQAGMENDRSAMFIRDMIVMLENRKGISAGQRKYLDSLIDQGAPQIHNPEICEQIDEAMKVAGMELLHRPLGDFRYKLLKGWKLSEKQMKFLSSMLSKAEELKGGIPPLSDDDKRLAESLILYGYARGDYYWQHRPGQHQTWQNAIAFFDSHGTLLESDFSRLVNAFKGTAKTIRNPRFAIGDMCAYSGSNGMVMSSPYASKGAKYLLVDILIDGDVQTVVESSLGKRLVK